MKYPFPLNTWTTVGVANMTKNFHLYSDRFFAGDVNQLNIRMLATTTFPFLAINEMICNKLELTPERKVLLTLPDKKEIICDYVLGVEIRFESMYGLLGAYVLPGNSTPMLGITPMQLLNLHIDPLLQTLVTAPAPLIKI